MTWCDSEGENLALIPREKKKNEDQEWWKRFYQHHHHERNGSQDSTDSNSSESSVAGSPDGSPPRYEQAILPSFPSPPHSIPSLLNKPLPPIPLKKRASQKKTLRRRNGDKMTSLAETQEQKDLQNPLPPISLVRFSRGWRNDHENSWSGSTMTVEEHGKLMEALDAPFIRQNKGGGTGSGGELEDDLGARAKEGWL